MVVEYGGPEDMDADDFQTYNESEFAEGDEYDENQILQLDKKESDAIGHFNDHADSIYCIDYLIREVKGEKNKDN